MSSGSGREDLIEGINVTPLVDILLVLLVIFLATATVVDRTELGVQLPTSSGSKIPQESASLTISLNSRGEIFLMERQLLQDDLIRELSQLRKSRADLKIRLEADRSLPYGSVTQLLGEIRSTGFTHVALGVED